jgi:hypothetical protein
MTKQSRSSKPVASFFFHTSSQYPVACAIEVTLNTSYTILFMYYTLLEDVLFIATCFGSVSNLIGVLFKCSLCT